MRRTLLAGLLALGVGAGAARAAFVNFESGQVRPLALSPSQGLLFVCNTPDNRLAVYTVGSGALGPVAEVPVGLEPVAVATRAAAGGKIEAWVVNHLSDSVSVVEVDPAAPSAARVIRTLLVGDEPRDVVFAGPGFNRAFVTAAHRGQNRPGDPQLTTPGTGRADVWVFDATATGAALGGTPITIVTLFGDTPRALASSPDGSIVYAAVFHSGNRTTTLPESVVTANGGLPPPPAGFTPNPPATGLIVAFDPASGRWEDEIGRNWSTQVPFSLPDRDVFLIDANASPPVPAGGANSVTGVGTVLFNMAVRPDNGKVYVSNTEARNRIRFEPTLRGHLTESRITVIAGTTTTAVHLNPHVNYAVVPGPAAERDQSLAFPTGMAFTSDGQTVFVAGLGSGKVAVLDTDALEAGVVTPRQLLTVGQGPSGLAYDTVRDQLLVLNRIDQTLSIVTSASLPGRAVSATIPLRYDPSPAVVRNGRRFLYDASISGHGDGACFSCHIYGDFDSLAWDLGDPFGAVVPNPNGFRTGSGSPFHPMKGPMTTQSLRGMSAAGPMHWRGDRTGASDPGGNAQDTQAAFKKFNPAFVGLLGNGSQLSMADMQAFTDFIHTVVYPPSPIRALDGSLTAAQSTGQAFFRNNLADHGNTCVFCHVEAIGTAGLSSIEGEPQEFKVPHLRNQYQKVGMFAVAGAQVRGFGFLHDGSIDTAFTFLRGPVFTFPGGDAQRRDVEQLMLAFETGLDPVVGQQVSVSPATVNDPAVVARIDLLIARAAAARCDLVAKGRVGGVERGWRFVGSDRFQPDRNTDATVDKAALRALAATAGQELTYTCVPPGSGTRIGIDRDEDGFYDRTEVEAGSDPANPGSTPTGQTTTTTTSTTTTTFPGFVLLLPTTSLIMRDDASPPVDPARRRIKLKSSTAGAVPHITVPAPGSSADPRIVGAQVVVYNTAGSGESATVPLPAAGWSGDASGLQFRDSDPAAAITKVQIVSDRLTLKGGGASFGYTLDEAAQGSVGVRLELGTATRWCTSAPARVSGSPPSTAAYDRPGRFKAQRKSPAPSSCPPLS